MNVTVNQYQQLHDYVTQIISLSGKDGLPTINQTVVAKYLHVDSSGISRFLRNETKKPSKLLSNLKATYPLEFQQWPEGGTTIGRILQKIDALYFFGQATRPSQLQAPTPSPRRTDVQQLILPSALPATTEVTTKLAPRILFPTETTLVIEPAPAVFALPNIEAPRAPEPAQREEPIAVADQAPQPPRRRDPVIVQIDLPKAPMAISYRGHKTTKDAQGMLFDHMRFQTVTQFSSYTLVPEDEVARTNAVANFKVILRSHVAPLPFGVAGEDLVKVPQTVQNCADLGLLIIPGRARANEDEPIRLNHEYKVIRSALNRGQPILAICAGSWRLWEQLLIWTSDASALADTPNTLFARHQKNLSVIPVSGHTYSRMPNLDRLGVQAVYNIQIHDIVIEDNTLLKNALGNNSNRLETNSVHSKAVNPQRSPLNIRISAIAAESPTLNTSNRQGEMEPDEGVVEGFESISGVPLMGIQWHPEAYFGNTPHSKLLKYMALTGSAYAAKRRMLNQMNERHTHDARVNV